MQEIVAAENPVQEPVAARTAVASATHPREAAAGYAYSNNQDGKKHETNTPHIKQLAPNKVSPKLSSIDRPETTVHTSNRDPIENASIPFVPEFPTNC